MYLRRLAAPVSVLFLAWFATPVSAAVVLPCLFSDHMVLQRDKPVAVWGWADAGEEVRVSVAGQTASAKAGTDGHWKLTLGPLPAGGPHEMVVQGTNKLTIADVLVGEVWLCSGQSNMAMTVSSAADFEKEKAASAAWPKIRMITIARNAAEEPVDRCEGDWRVCSPETVGGFSATAYFFGRTLHEELDVPVGLVTSAWGGTAVEAWTSIEAQQSKAELKPLLDSWKEQIASYDAAATQARYEKSLAAWKAKVAQAKAAGKAVPRKPAAPVDPKLSQNRPANLFNGMIQPLIPYAVRGATWYQGERNSHGQPSALYGLQLQTLITDWRARFGQGDFPFLFVQLPNFMKPQEQPSEHTGWVVVREGMLKTLELPNTGMAITVDVGDAGNIHPKNKQAVGYRLGLWGLATVYGQKRVYSGPICTGSKVEGNRVVLTFDHTGDGLKTADGGAVKGFAVAGADRKFVWADAQVAGDSVTVTASEVKNPVAVRYAWASNPAVNLVNSAGLPASPFRTDDWVEPIAER
ncbi:MAG: sialate O-acetylesterase [Thermoguttaceae bacterium]